MFERSEVALLVFIGANHGDLFVREPGSEQPPDGIFCLFDGRKDADLAGSIVQNFGRDFYSW